MPTTLRTNELAQAQDILRQVGWLTYVPEAFRERVLRHTILRRYQPGESIFSVGDPPGGIFGLTSGAMEVSIAPERQGPYMIHFVGPGFWIGEATVFTEGPRLVSMRATRETEMVHLPLAELDRILREDPQHWRWLGVLLVLHVRILLSIIDDMTIRDVGQRCAAIILRLAGVRTMFDYKDPRGPIEVSQDALAAMVNVSRNTLGTILRSFQQDGLIDLKYRNITVLKPVELDALIAE